MRWYEVVFVALLIFWLPMTGLVYLLFSLRARDSWRRTRLELERAERDFSYRERSDYDVRRALDEITRRLDFQEHMSRDLGSEIAERVSVSMRREVAEALSLSARPLVERILQDFGSEIAHKLSSARDEIAQAISDSSATSSGVVSSSQPSSLPNGGGTNFRIVSELAHSLKTPIAHIEASVRLLSTTGGAKSDRIGEVAGNMLQSVEICKATLAAFRGVTRVSGHAESWAPHTLPDALLGAHHVYSQQVEKSTELVLDLPDTRNGLLG